MFERVLNIPLRTLPLTFLWRKFRSNQSLQSKSMNWLLYNIDFRHERVNLMRIKSLVKNTVKYAWDTIYNSVIFIDYNVRLKDNGNDIFVIITLKNTVISPNFLVWKLCGKAQFPHSFGRFARPKLCGNCAFPQNFHTRKLG